MLNQESEPKIGLLARIVFRLRHGPNVNPDNRLVNSYSPWFYKPSLTGQPVGIKEDPSVDKTTKNAPNQ